MHTMFDRRRMLEQLEDRDLWDLLVIGGGATGAGVVLDAAARGLRAVLVEQYDFGKGTSSRSTKLIHGGVRYLRHGDFFLVREALHERHRLRRLAPHLVYEKPFVVPAYRFGARIYYAAGLRLYDALAGRYGLQASRVLTPSATLEYLPTLIGRSLRGGVLYADAAFDDARLLVNLIQTAVEQRAVCLNYARVVELIKDHEKISGARVLEQESGREYTIRARAVVNATGPFADHVRRMDQADAWPLLVPSQGIHLVLPKRFLPGSAALMVPKTADRRVMFAIPWYDRIVVGTTDTPLGQPEIEPAARREEIEFLLATAGQYLSPAPRIEDVLSVFAGIRPLVRAGRSRTSAGLSRDHTIVVSASGLITITGGKWTTYRRMAQDCVDRAVALAGLDAAPCRTAELLIHGARQGEVDDSEWARYGADAPQVAALCESRPELMEPLHPALPYRVGEVVWAVRHEFARTVEDILSRRTRALLLDARAAIEAAPTVAHWVARERQLDAAWEARQVADFRALAERYLISAGATSDRPGPKGAPHGEDSYTPRPDCSSPAP